MADDDLAQWLEKLDLGKYAEILAEHEVRLRDLPHLTEDDLKDLGLPLGPTRRLLAAIKGNEFSASVQPEQRIEEADGVLAVVHHVPKHDAYAIVLGGAVECDGRQRLSHPHVCHRKTLILESGRFLYRPGFSL